MSIQPTAHAAKPAGRNGASRESGGGGDRGGGFGRFERMQAAPPMSEINMTPLIDVMLVLLVIFIITAPLMVSAVKVDLPKSAAGVPASAPKFIALAIAPGGQVYVQDQPQDLAGVAQALQTAARVNPQTEVQLRADASVPYGRVVEVMGLAQKAGLSRIGFVAQTTPSSPAQ